MRFEVRGPGLFLAPLLVALFEGLFGAVALVAKALECFAQIAVLFGSFFGLVFPLLSALSEFGLLAHPAPPGQAWCQPGRWTLWNPADQDSEAQVAMHHASAWGPRPEWECGDEVHILGKKIEPVWPFLDGLRQYHIRNALGGQAQPIFDDPTSFAPCDHVFDPHSHTGAELIAERCTHCQFCAFGLFWGCVVHTPAGS
jgi:hypothetical protein